MCFTGNLVYQKVFVSLSLEGKVTPSKDKSVQLDKRPRLDERMPC